MVDGSSRMRVIIMTDVVYSHFPSHHLFCGGGKPTHSFFSVTDECCEAVPSRVSSSVNTRSIYPALCFPLLILLYLYSTSITHLSVPFPPFAFVLICLHPYSLLSPLLFSLLLCETAAIRPGTCKMLT